MDKATLRGYAKVKAQIKELEGKRDAMKVDIIKKLEKEGITKEVTDFGTFTRESKVTYTYSDKVLQLAEKVKLAKIREEEKGIAKPSTSEYLVFTPKKV